MTIKIEVDGLLKKYEDNDSKNLAKASKALSEKVSLNKFTYKERMHYNTYLIMEKCQIGEKQQNQRLLGDLDI